MQYVLAAVMIIMMLCLIAITGLLGYAAIAVRQENNRDCVKVELTQQDVEDILKA